MEAIMTLVRFRPENDFESSVIPKTFSEMLDTFFNDAITTRGTAGSFLPGVDVIEHDKTYEINVTLPGMKKENVNIELEDNVLTVSGERKFENEEKNKKFHLVESRYGKFSRSFTLPRNIKRDSIQAGMSDGILNISVEKDEKAVSRQISIN
jgi:HSP20 family protein